METILSWIQKSIVTPFRDWIMANYSNPFLWVGLVLIGLIVFGITYNTLNKD